MGEADKSQMEARRKSELRTVRQVALAVHSGGGRGSGSAGPGGAGGTRPDPCPQAAHPLLAPAGVSPRPPCAAERENARQLEGRAGPGPRNGGRAPGAAGGAGLGRAGRRPPPAPPPRCPPRTPRNAAWKTNVSQASVVPWKFYISVVYFFPIFFGIVYRTFSHLTNVRLNRSENMK